MLYPEADIYNRGPKDFKFHQRNFFIHYSSLLDRNMFKNDRSNYIKLLGIIQNSLSGVDFKQDILFICNERIQKEVFLCGMLTFENLMSYYYCNILKIADIWLGNTKQNNPNSLESDIYFSEQDIKDSILCLYCDSDVQWNRFDSYDTVTRNLIISRSVGNRSDGKGQYNWTFFRGLRSQMRKSGMDNGGSYSHILDYYESDGTIIDFNTNDEFILNVKSIFKKKKFSKGCENTQDMKYKSNREEDLSDIY